MKKNYFFALFFSLTLLLTACVEPIEEPQEPGTPVVFTSFHVMYDFTRTIAGDAIQVEVLSPPGADAHHWEPSVQDMVRLQDADLFIYHGAGIEHFVDSLKDSLDLPADRFITASAGIEPEFDYTDPHFWLNPVYAMRMFENIRDALAELSPENADVFEQNFIDAVEQALHLQHAYLDAARHFERHHIIVSHAAFGHLAHFLGIEQIALEGHHHGADPSPAHMAEVISFVEENGITTIFYDKDPHLAEAVAAATGTQTAFLDTFEGITDYDYFTVMWRNLVTLAEALGVPDDVELGCCL